MLLYFIKSKKARICCFIVFLCQYIHSFVLLEISGGEAKPS